MIGDRIVVDAVHVKAAEAIAGLLLPQIEESTDRFIISIAGESGSGKSEIATVLSSIFNSGEKRCVTLQQDDYFVYPPRTNAVLRRNDIRHVGISEVQLKALDRNLDEIAAGKPQIKKPLVVFEEDMIIEETINLDGANSILVEGTYTTLLNNAHYRIFLERTYIDTARIRRQRIREKQDEFLEKILHIEHKIISCHKHKADIIVTNDYNVTLNSERKIEAANSSSNEVAYHQCSHSQHNE
ncbi:MAG: hypothetical protein ACLFVK_05020 [Dehalococcoidia bacterium]